MDLVERQAEIVWRDPPCETPLCCSRCGSGSKHKTMLEARSGAGPIKAYPRPGAKLKNGSATGLKGSGLQNKTFHCQICDVHVNSEIQLKQVATQLESQAWWWWVTRVVIISSFIFRWSLTLTFYFIVKANWKKQQGHSCIPKKIIFWVLQGLFVGDRVRRSIHSFIHSPFICLFVVVAAHLQQEAQGQSGGETQQT